MENVTDIAQVQRLLSRELSLDIEGKSSNSEELLGAITSRVAQLLQEDVGLLFSYLYRLDIPENQVQRIMDPSWQEPTDISLARLILERQLQRLHTKKTIIQRPIKGWEW